MKVLVKGNKAEKTTKNWHFKFSQVGFEQTDCCCYDDRP